MTSDSQRWNARYSEATPPPNISPHAVLIQALEHASTGEHCLRAADIAAGWGDGGLWLAQHGVDATCFDVSSVACEAIAKRARNAALTVTATVFDTVVRGVPAGPWDLISCVHYLDRYLLASLHEQLAGGGVTAIAIATKRNLERHERPSARFLLEPGELSQIVLGDRNDMTVIRSDETWRNNGAHEAWLIARKDSA